MPGTEYLAIYRVNFVRLNCVTNMMEYRMLRRLLALFSSLSSPHPSSSTHIPVNNAIMTPPKSSRTSRSSSPSIIISLSENLVEAVQTQLDLISSFRLWLDRHSLTGCSHSSSSEVNAHLISVVGEYKGRIDDLESKLREPIQPNKENQVQEDAVPEDAWKLQVHQKKASDKPVLLIAIGSHSPVEVEFEKSDELQSAVGVSLEFGPQFIVKD